MWEGKRLPKSYRTSVHAICGLLSCMISRGLFWSCEKVHYNIYWSNLDYIGQHSQSRMRMNTLFSNPACVFLTLIKPCYEAHVESELCWWYLPIDQKPFRAMMMHGSYWKVPFSCCENLNVRYLPAFDSGDAHWKRTLADWFLLWDMLSVSCSWKLFRDCWVFHRPVYFKEKAWYIFSKESESLTWYSMVGAWK